MATADFSLVGRRVYVPGHRGMVGAALVRRLADEGCTILTAGRTQLDLRDQAAVRCWFGAHKPEVVFLAAAKVGGIAANNEFRADFIYDNLAIATNVIHASHVHGVRKLMFLGSSCIYPKFARQPMDETQLLQGALEPTNEPYAIAKIAGLKLAESFRRQHGDDFISVMPTNLYGAGDNYHPEHSHVVAALIRRFHEGRRSGDSVVTVWGTETPRREFLLVDDLADACVHLMKTYSGHEPVNVGTGSDVTIGELAAAVARTVGFAGSIAFDPSRPDGAPRKLLDVSRLAALGWTARTGLDEGLRQAYAAFLSGVQRES